MNGVSHSYFSDLITSESVLRLSSNWLHFLAYWWETFAGLQLYTQKKRYDVCTPISGNRKSENRKHRKIVYSLWNGMPNVTQIHILKLSASCRIVRALHCSSFSGRQMEFANFASIKVFLLLSPTSNPPFIFNGNMYGTAAVVQGLNESSLNRGWALFWAVENAFYSSGEKKTAWISDADRFSLF